jgi:hypothetical protein
MSDKKQLSDKEIEEIALKKSFDEYYKKTGKSPMENQGEAMQFHMKNENVQQNPPQEVKPSQVPPKQSFDPEQYMHQQMKETDPDLMIDTDVVPLPSAGKFYPFKKELTVEYLTAKDEDVLTTPALMENGTVLDEILKRKIKTPDVDVKNMLTGDKNAVLIFLRASSYGHIYDVEVTNPSTGKAFKSNVDLRKIEYKKLKEHPDEKGEFFVELPMRKKIVKFRLLSDDELRKIIDRAEQYKEAYSQIFAETSTMRLKAAITEIGGNRNKDYINRFVDAMPAGDALTVRRKMEEVTPGVDLTYEFVSPEGHLFRAPIAMGLDFFFPSL